MYLPEEGDLNLITFYVRLYHTGLIFRIIWVIALQFEVKIPILKLDDFTLTGECK
jgi:hypothetical protein